MPDKHLYFALGALTGSGLSYLAIRFRSTLEQNNNFVKKLTNKVPDWELYLPALIFLVGLWGLVPDIIHALNILPKEVTRIDLFNIFFFHSYFEYIEDTNHRLDQIFNWLGEGILFIIAISCMCYYIHLVKKAISQHEHKSNHG
jgi:hypothetical protein